jgi:hypothetical protein
VKSKTFYEMVRECRTNSDTKQPQLMLPDLLTQILHVLVEIRDELKKPAGAPTFWPDDENGNLSAQEPS